MKSPIRVLPFIASHPVAATTLVAMAFAAGCASTRADLELDSAQKVLERARVERAADCATELYQAAEAALAAARELNAAGNGDEAKLKAAEAENLAAQAMEKSPPGCDQVAEPEEPVAENVEAGGRMDLTLDTVLQTIYFDYNDATIRDEGKQVLNQVAEVLLQAPSQRLEVEGHCDVRGSTEYNLHLGERRAQAVVKYLIKQGVGAEQLSVISYGEERPVDLGGSEDAHQRNRRAELKDL